MIEQIKKLRALTGAGVLECRQALEQAGGDEKKALAVLKQKGAEIAEKKKARATGQGLIEAYSHHAGQVVSVVELLCETDFVARNPDFRALAHELALQIAAMAPNDQQELLRQPYIRDPNKKVAELLAELVGKTRENIQIGRIARFELGE